MIECGEAGKKAGVNNRPRVLSAIQLYSTPFLPTIFNDIPRRYQTKRHYIHTLVATHLYLVLNVPFGCSNNE